MCKENIVALVKMVPIKVTEDIFYSEEQKQLFLNSSEEEKELFLLELTYDWDKEFEIEIL